MEKRLWKMNQDRCVHWAMIIKFPNGKQHTSKVVKEITISRILTLRKDRVRWLYEFRTHLAKRMKRAVDKQKKKKKWYDSTYHLE